MNRVNYFSEQPSNDMKAFRQIFNKAKHIAILTGAGVSAESGVPTFRGAGGYWRTYNARQLATPQSFQSNPSLVWEFYNYRRELILTTEPNPAHKAIAECESRLKAEGRRVVVITQNIDELHRRAGTENIIELHGSLFKTLCLGCGSVVANNDSPICPALKDKGAPDPKAEDARIPESDLPRCKDPKCKALLRPGVIWFGETLLDEDLDKADEELKNCDLCLMVGTSSVVYPAALLAPLVAARGIPVAEFNLETTSTTNQFGFYFEGLCGVTLLEALAP